MTSAFNQAGIVPEWTKQDRIRKARELREMKQSDLAAAIGVSRGTLASIEQGVREPRRGEVIAISFATGVSLEWLETGKTPADDNGGGEKWAHWDSNPRPAGIGSKPSDQGRGRVA